MVPYLVKSKLSNSHTQGNLASFVGVVNFEKLGNMNSEVNLQYATYQSLEAQNIFIFSIRCHRCSAFALKVVVKQFDLQSGHKTRQGGETNN